MTKLDMIKKQMRENVEELIKYQEAQLKAYEEAINSNNIDELDEIIQEQEEEFRFTNILNEIAYKEKENFHELMDLAWESKKVEFTN